MGKLNHTLKNNQCVKEEMMRENGKYFEINESEKQNLWNAAKAILKGKLISMNTYIKKRTKVKSIN